MNKDLRIRAEPQEVVEEPLPPLQYPDQYSRLQSILVSNNQNYF